MFQLFKYLKFLFIIFFINYFSICYAAKDLALENLLFCLNKGLILTEGWWYRESVSILLSKAKPLYSPNDFPGDSKMAVKLDFKGQIILTKEIKTIDLPYDNSIRSERPTSRLDEPYAKFLIKDKVEILDIAFASTENSGTTAIVRLAILFNGRPVAAKAVYQSNGQPIKKQSSDLLPKFEKGANAIKRFSDIGIGPKFHGVYEASDGTLYIITDIVNGDFNLKPSLQGFKDMEIILSRLKNNGYTYLDDFQSYISPEGRVIIIDASTSPEDFNLHGLDSYSQAREELLRRADKEIGIQYLNELEIRNKEAWDNLKDDMSDNLGPTDPLLQYKDYWKNKN